MSAQLYIDGAPLEDLGVILAPDSYKSLLQFPALKSVKTNDWAEHDYIEADLHNPTLSKRTVTLNFHANGLDGYERFMAHLETKANFEWNFADLGVFIVLRVDSNSLKHTSEKWQSFSISFYDDEPYSPNSLLVPQWHLGGGGITLDDEGLDKFGVYVLDGTTDKIRQQGKVKQRLTIDDNSENGAVYDGGGTIQIASNEISVKCLIRAASMPVCVRNYYTLLNRIVAPELRCLFVGSLSEMIDCYYKSATCEDVCLKLNSGNAGIAFTLTFTVVNRYSMAVLSDDEAEFVLTTDGGTPLTK
jgi:hypothetical protein